MRIYNNFTNNIRDETIHKIQMNTEFSQTAMESYIKPESIGFSRTITLNSIDFRLTDESNNIINLNGIPWSITILLIRY